MVKLCFLFFGSFLLPVLGSRVGSVRSNPGPLQLVGAEEQVVVLAAVVLVEEVLAAEGVSRRLPPAPELLLLLRRRHPVAFRREWTTDRWPTPFRP